MPVFTLREDSCPLQISREGPWSSEWSGEGQGTFMKVLGLLCTRSYLLDIWLGRSVPFEKVWGRAGAFRGLSRRYLVLSRTFEKVFTPHCILLLGYMMRKVPAPQESLGKEKSVPRTLIKVPCPSRTFVKVCPGSFFWGIRTHLFKPHDHLALHFE